MATVRLGRMTGKAMVLTGSTTEAAQAEEMNVTEKGTEKRAYFVAFFSKCICPVNSKSGFFVHSEKTQGEKTSKLKEITENSSSYPKKSALFYNFWHIVM